MNRLNKSFLSTITLLLVFSLLTFGFIPKANASTVNVDRLYGQDAYQTGVAIANAVNSGTVDNVILTSGITFQDALSGSVLAKQKNAPILLVDRTVKNSDTAFEYIKSHLNKAGAIYILGGTGIIPAEFETSLNDLGYNNIIRRGGWDQYDTALLIAKEKQAPIGTPVVIAYGENFPDALSFSSFAANKGWPILLTPTASIPDKLKEYLTAQNPSDVYIAGGTGVISANAEKQIYDLVPSASIQRISGWDQFDTSMAIAKSFAPSPNHIYVASGRNFPDALTGSVLAAQTGSPIVLIDPSSSNLPSSVVSYIQSLQGTGVANITLLGGTFVVPDALVSKIQAILAGTIIGQPLKISYINVGQGDSILIQTPAGKNILIDGGKTDQTATVENYLRSAGVNTLDYVIATHADADHIGSLDSVIKDFNIGKVYMPNVTNTTYTFADLLAAMQSKGLTFNRAKAGGTLDLGTGVEVKFVGPVEDSYTDANNYSAVLHLKYGSTSFLFTGDAETGSESDMITSGVDLKSTVLKVGHHGSNSSTSEAFLNAVSPKYAVITVGLNSYGHPTEDVLNRLNQHGVSVYRTDVSGTIVATSDGTEVIFNATPATPPITPPTTSSSVKITNIDLSAEIATITNTGTSAVDLTGWKLVSEQGSQTFDFPSGTIIQAGGSLKIASGPNAAAGTNTLVWTKSNMWNNTGDPGTLNDSQGQVVSRYPQ